MLDFGPKIPEHLEGTPTTVLLWQSFNVVPCNQEEIHLAYLYEMGLKWAIWPVWDLGPKIPEHPEGTPTTVLLWQSFDIVPYNL